MADERSKNKGMSGPEATGTSAPRRQRRAWLARRILDDLTFRDATEGSHVTEVALAEALDVSRSPVRSALELLAEHGVLKQIRNRGFFLCGDAGNFDGLILTDGGNAEDRLYASILKDHLDERNSGRFTKIELVRRYSAPESRIASALERLREEGLVIRNPGRGWTFKPTINTPESLAHSYALRLAVEPAALLQPGLTIDMPALELSRRRQQRLMANVGLESMTQARIFEIDSGFHEMLVGFSGNPHFLEAVQTQNRLRRIVEFVEYSDFAKVKVWCAEHIRIIDALAAGQVNQAAQELTAHLTRAYNGISRRL